MKLLNRFFSFLNGHEDSTAGLAEVNALPDRDAEEKARELLHCETCFRVEYRNPTPPGKDLLDEVEEAESLRGGLCIGRVEVDDIKPDNYRDWDIVGYTVENCYLFRCPEGGEVIELDVLDPSAPIASYRSLFHVMIFYAGESPKE